MHDLSGTVLGVIDDPEQVRGALSALTAAGFETELIQGEEGRAHLSPENEHGLGGTLQELILAFGDASRILDRMDRALDDRHSVISVDTEPDRAEEVAVILQEHSGRDMWRIGEWSFNRIGEGDDGPS